MNQQSQMVLTLSTCSIYNIDQHLGTLHLKFLSIEGNLLAVKKVEEITQQAIIHIPLGLKITFLPSEKEILMVLSHGKTSPLGQFPLDLQFLKQAHSQTFKMVNKMIARVSILSQEGKLHLDQFKIGKMERNQEFIRERQLFLQSVVLNREQGYRTIPKTPQFQKGSPERYQREQFQYKIQSLLTKTRQQKQQRLLEDGLQSSDNKFSRYLSSKQAFQKTKQPRLMAPFEELQEQQVIFQPRRVIHEHYHHHSPLHHSSSSPYKKFIKTLDIETLVCRTNDSESVSSHQEQLTSPKSLLNAKRPFKYIEK